MRQLVAHAVQLVDGGVEIRDDVALRTVERLRGGLRGSLDFRGHGVGDGGYEGGVDLFVDFRGAGVGDFRRDRVFLFVDVVRDVRTFGGTGDGSDQRCAEVIRQYDCRIVFAGFHAVEGVRLADETPAELMIGPEFANGLRARVEVSDERGIGTEILVGHGHLDVAGVGVRVPVGEDVAPCVQRRNQGYAAGHDQRHGTLHDASDIARENGENRSHIFLRQVEHSTIRSHTAHTGL